MIQCSQRQLGKSVPLSSKGENWDHPHTLLSLHSLSLFWTGQRNLLWYVRTQLCTGEAWAPELPTLAQHRQQEYSSKSSAPWVLTGVGLGFNSDYITNTFPCDKGLIAGIDGNHRASGGIKTLRKAVLSRRQIILLLTLGVNHRSSYSLFANLFTALLSIKRAKPLQKTLLDILLCRVQSVTLVTEFLFCTDLLHYS